MRLQYDPHWQLVAYRVLGFAAELLVELESGIKDSNSGAAACYKAGSVGVKGGINFNFSLFLRAGSGGSKRPGLEIQFGCSPCACANRG